MKRNNYREPIPRCQAVTLRKKRCTRDAVAQHAGKAYCARHHESELAKGKK